MLSEELAKRAEEFSALLENEAMDENGLVRILLDYETRKAPDERTGIPSFGNSGIPGHLFMPYEDAGMATGAYLAAESLHARLSGSEAARRRAGKAFLGIRYVYGLGTRGLREGFFPKPYAAQFSRHCSRDQYLLVMSGLTEYHSIASSEEKAQIERMLGCMAEHWRFINYSPGYLTLKPTPQLYDYIAPMFLGIECIPCRFSSSPECEHEVDRLVTEEKLGENAVDTLIARFRRGETYDGAMYIRQNENPAMLKALAMDHLWEALPAYRDLARKSLEKLVEDALFKELASDGLNYYIMRYDSRTDAFVLTPSGNIPELQNPLKIPFLTWGGDRRRAGSTQTAFAAVLAASRLKDRECARKAYDILRKLTLDKFHGFTASSAADIPPDSKYTRNILYCNYLSFWLWTYYLAQSRGILPASI